MGGLIYVCMRYGAMLKLVTSVYCNRYNKLVTVILIIAWCIADIKGQVTVNTMIISIINKADIKIVSCDQSVLSLMKRFKTRSISRKERKKLKIIFHNYLKSVYDSKIPNRKVYKTDSINVIKNYINYIQSTDLGYYISIRKYISSIIKRFQIRNCANIKILCEVLAL